MKQTKIGVEIHKEGFNNSSILRIVGRSNGGENVVDKDLLTAYIKAQKIEYFNANKETVVIEEADHTIHISEDAGKTFTLTLTWKEVETLDDLPQEIFTSTKEESTN